MSGSTSLTEDKIKQVKIDEEVSRLKLIKRNKRKELGLSILKGFIDIFGTTIASSGMDIRVTPAQRRAAYKSSPFPALSNILGQQIKNYKIERLELERLEKMPK